MVVQGVVQYAQSLCAIIFGKPRQQKCPINLAPCRPFASLSIRSERKISEMVNPLESRKIKKKKNDKAQVLKKRPKGVMGGTKMALKECCGSFDKIRTVHVYFFSLNLKVCMVFKPSVITSYLGII